MKFVLASNNKKKIAELREILGPLGAELVSQADMGMSFEVSEDGATFEENSLKKARFAMAMTGLPAIADDSGLCVDALGGEPGVRSARYGGADCESDLDRCELLLKNMESVEERGARFVCVISCAMTDGSVITARGECGGEILREMRGGGGFGYDPLFFVPEKGKTMAEMSAEEKNSISHRGRAIAAFAEKLEGINADK